MTSPQPATSGPASGNKRTIGLFGATSVGVGAIVGGGILVLAGVAFKATGPSALIAFGLNAVLAVITALSFAEMSSSFPESGGAYTFAKKVLSAQAAFAVGWMLWFAYIVAGVLYALGFAEYALLAVSRMIAAAGSTPPAFLTSRAAVVLISLVSAGGYAVSLAKQATGGGQLATWGKVVVFGLLIIAGFWVLLVDDGATALDGLSPFFSGGGAGLLQAMGFTFIALQGFDLIAAIAGEVKRPSYTIPRAMLISLAIAIAVYLPLLFVVSTVGVPAGDSIAAMSAKGPAVVMATAVNNFLGPVGYWLVVIAAILSTLSALQANLLAASRVALSMAGDRSLPSILAGIHPTRRTPVVAVFASALALAAILLMVPDVAAAGAAASLIFLIVFALGHGTTYLARRRGKHRKSQIPALEAPRPAEERSVQGGRDDAREPRFRTPWFPVVPVVGGIACLLMAIFQAVAVPAAGAITLVWLGLGVLLYLSIFSSRSKSFDAYTQGRDPELVRLRGHSPLVLVPVANPAQAPTMVGIASALAPLAIGKVLLLSVMAPLDQSVAERKSTFPDEVPDSLAASQAVLQKALLASLEFGHQPECLLTIAPAPWNEIRRVATDYRVTGLLLGLSDDVQSDHLEELLNELDCDVTFVRAPVGFRLRNAHRILVPIGGRGAHVELRARLLGSLSRAVPHEITWLQVMPKATTDAKKAEALRDLQRQAADNVEGKPEVEILLSDDPAAAIAERTADFDVIILGLQRLAGGRRVFGDFALRVNRHTKCAMIMLSRGE